jgi:hypothetical protein
MIAVQLVLAQHAHSYPFGDLQYGMAACHHRELEGKGVATERSPPEESIVRSKDDDYEGNRTLSGRIMSSVSRSLVGFLLKVSKR